MGIKCLKTLQIVIQKLNNTDVKFTKIHPLFLSLCIACGNYKLPLSIIEIPLASIEKNAKIDDLDLYLYYYYCGVIFIALKDHQKAIQYLTWCLSS